MRRRTAVVRCLPDFSALAARDVGLLLPKASGRMPRLAKAAILALGACLLVLLARLDYGSGVTVADRPAPRPMASVEVSVPPPSPSPEVPQDVPQEVLPTSQQVPQPPSIPSVGILQDASSGGSGSGLPGPALDLGVAGGKGMGVATGGGGHGGGVGTGVGSGAGSGVSGARFVYNPGETDTDPRLLASPDPVYPRRAREDGIEPRVELRVLVDEHGHVAQVDVMGAPAGYGFEAALRTAVLQWRFQPATKGGVPVRTWVSQGYQFRLD